MNRLSILRKQVFGGTKMNAVGLINGFLSYLLLMVITLGFAFFCAFLARKLRKRNDAKKDKE